MNAESLIQTTCGKCNAVLKAKPELAGKIAKCPKCGTTIEIPSFIPPKKNKNSQLATQRQKEYAQTLGVVFREDITRTEISKLIDEAVTKRDDERFARLEEYSRREGKAYEQIRQEVLEEIDEEDCRLSKAETSHIVEALSERGFASILITLPCDEIDDFENLQDVSVCISSSDDMSQEDMEVVMMQIAGQIMIKKGLA